MAMEIAPFINLYHDEALRKAFLTVDNKEVKQQREMWGTLFHPHIFIPY
jgi:large subunit ribosomal protein L6